jgi:hypothetical protein
MAGVKHVAVNDGSIGLNFPGNYTRSDRKTDKPVASLEVSHSLYLEIGDIFLLLFTFFLTYVGKTTGER